MNYSEMVDRREAIVRRELAIDVLLTQAKKEYFASGQSVMTMAERTELEAEAAVLRQDKHALTELLHERKRALSAARRMTSHAILINLLIERGLTPLVSMSERMAMDQQLKTGEQA